MNQGYTLTECAEMISLPQSLAGRWYNRDFYGTVNFNVKAVYQRYLGWFEILMSSGKGINAFLRKISLMGTLSKPNSSRMEFIR
jgi:alkyl sulfatase BDS1-like metallo-beta-lactamase superfamily hydrolase